MNLRIVQSSSHRLTLALEGSLDLAGAEEVESAFLSAVGAEPRSVVVDLSAVTFVASFGLRLLLKAHKHLTPSNQKLILFRPAPMVRKVLLHAGMESVLSIVDSEEEIAAVLA